MPRPAPMRSYSSNDFQTPGYALHPLYKYMRPGAVVFEPAAGTGNLVTALKAHGFAVDFGDIITGQDFFQDEYPPHDYHVTNPPYGLKEAWLARCYDIGIPFALLMPVTSLGNYMMQKNFDKYGVEVIFFDGRVKFETPTGGVSSPWYPVAWFTWGFGIGKAYTFTTLKPPFSLRDR